MSDSRYLRRLGLFSATMMVVGGIIGSGIFLNPAVVAQRVTEGPAIMAVWGLGAVIAMLGALVFAELGARRPKAGGSYAYLSEAFGALPGFLYAWANLLVIGTGAAAAVAMTASGYLTELAGAGSSMQQPLAAGAIVFLSLLNIVGVRPAAWTQNVFTVLKLLAIAILVVTALVAVQPSGTAVVAATATAPSGSMVLAVGAALVPVLFAFGGWQQTNFVAEEIIEPERNLPRALIIGVAIVGVSYLLANLAYLKALGPGGLAASIAPAADTMNEFAGSEGRRIIAIGIVISTLGFLNLVLLAGPRVYHALARDGQFLPSFARLHPRWRTPVTAIVVQGVWALVLVYSGSYGQLLDYVTFADWIAFGATAAALFVLRRRDGDRAVTFKAPGQPWSTLIFIAAACFVVIGSITSNPRNALLGSGIILLGVPFYFYWHLRQKPR